MEILILCGGKGTRLESALGSLPKVLAPVYSKPFLFHQLNYINRYPEVQSVTLLTGKGHEDVKEFVDQSSKHWNFKVHLIKDERPNLGTYGALRDFALKVNKKHGHYLVMFGDSLPRVDLFGLFQEMKLKAAPIVLTYIDKHKVRENPNVGIKKGECVIYSKQPNKNNNFVDYGITLFSLEFLRNFGSTHTDIKDVLEDYSTSHCLVGVQVEIPFIEIGTPKALEYANRETTFLGEI